MSCNICNGIREAEKDIKMRSHKRAKRNAHEIASQIADKGLVHLSWCEIYTVYFPKIYDHEYKRSYNYEKYFAELVLFKNDKIRNDVCDYHWESILFLGGDFEKRLNAKIRKEFSESKWCEK